MCQRREGAPVDHQRQFWQGIRIRIGSGTRYRKSTVILLIRSSFIHKRLFLASTAASVHEDWAQLIESWRMQTVWLYSKRYATARVGTLENCRHPTAPSSAHQRQYYFQLDTTRRAAISWRSLWTYRSIDVIYCCSCFGCCCCCCMSRRQFQSQSDLDRRTLVTDLGL